MTGGDKILVNVTGNGEVSRTLCCKCNTGLSGIDYKSMNPDEIGICFPSSPDSSVRWNEQERTDDPCPNCGAHTFYFKESGSIKKLVKKWKIKE